MARRLRLGKGLSYRRKLQIGRKFYVGKPPNDLDNLTRYEKTKIYRAFAFSYRRPKEKFIFRKVDKKTYREYPGAKANGIIAIQKILDTDGKPHPRIRYSVNSEGIVRASHAQRVEYRLKLSKKNIERMLLGHASVKNPVVQDMIRRAKGLKKLIATPGATVSYHLLFGGYRGRTQFDDLASLIRYISNKLSARARDSIDSLLIVVHVPERDIHAEAFKKAFKSKNKTSRRKKHATKKTTKRRNV